MPAKPPTTVPNFDTTERKSVIDAYVQKFTAGFAAPSLVSTEGTANGTRGQCVLVTGATGSLGAHLVADLVARQDVESIICLNRVSRGSHAEERQRQSFVEKGLKLEPSHLAKLRIIETDTSKARLGLSDEQYEGLAHTVTAVIHNAWPMSGVRPVQSFEAQFGVMRGLIDLARDTACTLRTITFQFISSIAVVGHYPLWSNEVHVPEDRVGIESVLPNGYGDAKYICERMLDATLHAHPSRFRAMSVRLGQVAGNSRTGYWNALEHLSFLIKSSQTLRALPDFGGQLSWTPVDAVASTLAELVLGGASGPPAASTPYPVYHIDNPVRQPWQDMVRLLARALNIPSANIVPFAEWVRRVRRFPGSTEKDNCAYKLIGFLDENFLRMSCGGLLLDTVRTRQHSPTLAALGPVTDETAVGYIEYWKRSGFLSA